MIYDYWAFFFSTPKIHEESSISKTSRQFTKLASFAALHQMTRSNADTMPYLGVKIVENKKKLSKTKKNCRKPKRNCQKPKKNCRKPKKKKLVENQKKNC